MANEDYTRSAIRFAADDNTLTLLDLSPSEDKFKPVSVGLAIDESSHGSGIVILKKHAPDLHQEVKIQVGKLAPMLAECVWIKELDEHVVRVGFHYKD